MTDIQTTQISLAIFAIVAFLVTQFTRLYFEKKATQSKLKFEEQKYLEEQKLNNKREELIKSEFLRLSEVSEPLARHLRIELTKNVEWIGEAMKRANLGINTDSFFAERMQHFNAEKKFIAKTFVPIILARCKNFILEKEKEVFLVVDSGTTTYAFFEELARETSKIYHSEKAWLAKVTIATNNLQGAQMLMDIGTINPRNRFSKLAIKKCFLFPGDLLPIYFAVIGNETEESIISLYNSKSDNNIFIGITTGNWVRIRTTTPRCPVPLVRGPKHRSFKQALIENVDEVFVLSPLGKIFRKEKQHEVNEALNLTEEAIRDEEFGEKEKYLELLIGKPLGDNKEKVNPKKVKLISTSRIINKRLLFHHSKAMEVVFESDSQKAISTLSEEIYKDGDIEKLPHLLFPFNELPEIQQFELETEFPHNKTRNPEFMKKYFGVEIKST